MPPNKNHLYFKEAVFFFPTLSCETKATIQRWADTERPFLREQKPNLGIKEAQKMLFT